MSTAKNKRKLVTIIAWFFIPLAIAITSYKLLPEDYRPTSMTNNGELLDPVFNLTEFSYQTTDGKTFNNKDIEKVWTILQFIENECDAACSESLYNTRQMRISFGKDIDRIDRVAVVSGTVEGESNQKMWASHPDLTVLIGTGAGNGMGQQIKDHVPEFNRSSNDIYLLDPLGNVVMRFPASLEVKFMKKDIKKLLKLSHIG
jgi:hypothetical protein